MKKYHRLALIGVLFLLPALLAVTSGVFGFLVPLTLISPFLVLPGTSRFVRRERCGTGSGAAGEQSAGRSGRRQRQD